MCSGLSSTSLKAQNLQVLLLLFTENVDKTMRTQMMELFSGEGRVSQVFRSAGVAAVSYDINLARPGYRAMDFLSEGGFAPEPQSEDLLPPGFKVGPDLRLAARAQCLEHPGARLWFVVQYQSRNVFED